MPNAELIPAVIEHQPPATVESLLASAVERGATVETLERLMAIRREVRAEQAKEAFDRAMSAFQAECPPIKKNKIVYQKNSSAIRYRYADLTDIVNQVKPILQQHGFSHSEDAIVEGETVTAVCKATHAQGHSETSRFTVPVDRDAYMTAPQQFASALTFGKRYAFCNAFGILTGDEDDDATSGKIDARQKAREAEAQKAQESQKREYQLKPDPASRSVASLKSEQLDLKTRIAGLKQWLGPKEKAAVAFLRLFLADGSDANCALSAAMSETLDDLQVSDLDTIKGPDGKGTRFMELLDDFIWQNPALVPKATDGPGEPQQGSTDAALPTSSTEHKGAIHGSPGAESPPLPDNCPKCQSPRLEYGTNYGHRVGVCGACDHHFLADLTLDKAWRNHRLPEKIKKNAGLHLGALAKNDLFGWCMNQKPDPKYPDSQRLRAMLDLAQACYNFQEKGAE